MMDDALFNIFVLYELNNEKEGEERYWTYKEMPPTAEWIGKGSTVPYEKDDSGKWSKRETSYPREEQFQCAHKYKEELIHYLNLFFSDLLLKKHSINRFIVTQTIQQYI
jgi:hypothetical protein